MLSLTEFTQNLVIYSLCIMLVIGTVGNSCNLITLGRKEYRTKAPVCYLLWSTSVSQVFIFIAPIIRFTTEFFGNNLMNTDRYVCKARNYLLVSVPSMTITFTLLASFDRCVSTSPHDRWRRVSSFYFAQRACLASMLFFVVGNSMFLFIYDIHRGRCSPQAGIPSIIINIYIVALVTVVPVAGTLMFGTMTWIHLKKSRNRVRTMSVSTNGIHHSRRIERGLMILIVIQTSMSSVVYGTRASLFLYLIVSSSVAKSVQRQQIEYFSEQLSVTMVYISHGIVFYLNYLCCSGFRKKFHLSLHEVRMKCRGFCGCS